MSDYRTPPAVEEIAVDRAKPLSQRISHDGVEQYERSPAFTISAGGVRTPSPYATLGFWDPDDEGIAMPTVIIPTIAGVEIEDLFAFNGEDTGRDRRSNLCVWKGFICGIQPQIPGLFRNCQKVSATDTTTIVFINSKTCKLSIEGPHFYLAAKLVKCYSWLCKAGMSWGFMEIVEAPNATEPNDPAFDTFRIQRGAAMAASVLDASGTGLYVAANGERIVFRIDPNTGSAQILTVNNTEVSFPRVFSAGGDPLRPGNPIESDGKGRATISAPSGAKVDIDFSDWSKPRRSP